MYTADVDIGGTFTDGFFTDGAGWRRSKVLTTPHDLTECFLHCLREGADRFGVPFRDFLRQSLVVRLSTTLGTNTLIQRRGPKIGLLVTRGHERDLYGGEEAAVLRLFLPPEMVVGIAEEVDAAGRSVRAPERREVLAAVRRLVDLGARLIAVSFAGSWRNPAHERAVQAIVRERYPEHYLRSIPLQLGHEVSPAADDHARTNTVVLNAYLHRELARGLYRAEDRARDQGMPHPLLVVHASAGCARVAKTVAIQTLSSGPAVAVSGAAAIARQLGLERVVTMDMGGTSLDVAVLDGAAPPVAQTVRVAGIPLALAMVETESIGAGGGSIAKVVDGRLEVGPESAGAAPGPACYDKGGLQPTVTDANLVLGFLDPDRFLGGRMQLNRQRAVDALARRLARPLGGTADATAAAVRARVNATMAAEIGARLRAHGGDPAAYTLFAFGGGGPLHACAIADQVGIRRVVGFPFGSVFSAFGSSTVDVRHQYWRNLVVPLAAPEAAERLAVALEELRRQATLDVRGEGLAGAVHYQLDLVLLTPGGARRRPCPAAWLDGGLDTATFLARLRAELSPQEAEPAAPSHTDADRAEASGAGAAHAERPAAPEADRVELGALALDARVAIPHWLPDAAPERPHHAEPRETRPVRWEAAADSADTPLYAYSDLEPGAAVDGPALIEAEDTSYAIPLGWRARLDGRGNLVVERP